MQGPVDFPLGGVVADGAAVIQGISVSGFQFEVKAWGKVIRGEGQRASEGEKNDREKSEKAKGERIVKEFDRLASII